MALNSPIIIPSKHIYDIDNQKVIDNQIDKIEVQVKVPQIINESGTVYNEKITKGWVLGDVQSETKWADALRTDNMGNGKTNIAISYIQMEPQYISHTFTIPKSTGNNFIKKILTGKNENGQANIGYTLHGKVAKGTSNADSIITIKTADITNVSISSIETSLPTEESSEIIYELTSDITTTDNPIENKMGGSSVWVTANAQITLSDLGNVVDATINLDNTINLRILSGLKTIKLGGIDWTIYNGETSLALSGTYEEYIPTQLDISFNGEIIKLDLIQETLIIGDGNNLYAYEGNELMQFKGNTANINILDEIIYTTQLGIPVYKMTVNSGDIKLLDDIWYKGDTAKVVNEYNGYWGITVYPKFDISEVYSNKVINMKGKGAFNSIACRQDSDIAFVNKYWDMIIGKWENGKELATIRCGIEDYYNNNGSLVISPNNNTPSKMIFDIGDIVIPYVYGANGKDKPMSLYLDGTPKQFSVVQTDIFYDGGVWQTLTLLEVTKN